MAVDIMVATDPAMRFRFTNGFWVGVNTAQDPTKEAWFEHCAEVQRVRHQSRGVLVYTEGGGPDSKQRQQLRSALQDLRAPPTAIVTTSPLARGIVTGLNWFLRDQNIAAFAPHDIDRALGYLAQGKVLPRDEILQALIGLADELGVHLPFSPILEQRPHSDASASGAR